MTTKKSKNIEVAVRMRPLLDKYEDHQAWLANSQQKTISSIPRKLCPNTSLNQDSSLSIAKRRQSKCIQKTNVYEFTYDYVFDQNQHNNQVYHTSCKKIVQQFTNGKNAAIFMYGQTTSGKTYTMLGSSEEQGLIIYSLKDIFGQLQKIKGKRHSAYISYMQIYNEQVNDLLNPEGINLHVVNDTPQGISQFQVASYGEALGLLEEGEKLRSYAEKNFHDHSSRSHTIFQIKLVSSETGKQTVKNVLNLVDLAGSQRVGQQDSTEETGYINKSLFVLSNVIHKLTQKKSGHVPFRDSKLTRVLSSSLTTSSHTMFICTISPAEINFTQTLSTLRFANQSRKIQLKCVQQSQIVNQSSFMIKQHQINKLRQQNSTLKKSLSQKQKQNQTYAGKPSLVLQTLQKLQHYLIEQNKQNKPNNRRRYHQQLKLTQSHQTLNKLHTLYTQYMRNIQVLQQQYIKAMINLTAGDLKLDKEKIRSQVIMREK